MHVDEILLTPNVPAFRVRHGQALVHAPIAGTAGPHEHQDSIRQGAVAVGDDERRQLGHRVLVVDKARSFDRSVPSGLRPQSERPERALFPQERPTGGARIPQDQVIDRCGSGPEDLGGQRGAHAQSDHAYPEETQALDERCRGTDASQPRVDPPRFVVRSCRVAGSVVVEAKHGEPRFGQAIRQASKGVPGVYRFYAESRAEDHSPASLTELGHVKPSEQWPVFRPEPEGTRTYAVTFAT